MKIIDILNNIANREYDKLPKKIKFDDMEWEFNQVSNDYVFENTANQLFNHYLNRSLIESLNDEVETIEETEIPEEIKDLCMIYHGDADDEIMRNRYKINEISKAINYLLNQNKEK